MIRRLVATSLILLTAIRAGAQSSPASAPAAIDRALLSQLTEIDKKAAAISDLRADFEQRKFTALLKKPLVSTGKLRIKGASMLWDTTAPEPTLMRIDDKEVRLYYPRQATLEIYPIDQRLASLAASPLPRLETLRRHFSIERAGASQLKADPKHASLVPLKLSPIEASLREHVDQVLVLLDASQGLILRAEVTDADGDRTAIDFSNIRLNTNLPEAEVRLEVPPNTRIVRPLEGVVNPQRNESK
jgi:outer membrane lipoprotein-sorting protein